MIKEIALALITIAFAVPFVVMILTDFYEVYKRLNEAYTKRLKPVMIVAVNSFMK